MSAAVSYATMLAKQGHENAVDLADVFCKEARMRIDYNFDHMFDNHDEESYRLVMKLLKDEYQWFRGPMVEPVMPTPEQIEEAMAKLA